MCVIAPPQFYDVNGNLLSLHCANWFGFNNGNLMLDGLWGGSSALVNDFATVMYRIQVCPPLPPLPPSFQASALCYYPYCFKIQASTAVICACPCEYCSHCHSELTSINSAWTNHLCLMLK